MDGITKSTISLLDNLLSWSKQQQGLISYEPSNVNLNSNLNEILNWLNMMARNKDISVSNELDETMEVYADPSAVNLIFRNLIVNAIKFSHTNGVVRIFSQEDNNMVIVGVQDNGIGMSHQKLSSVLSGTNKKSERGTLKETGTGFGIRLCKEFIMSNNGALWAESIENKQTIFYFSLPKVNSN
jgi:signal transduction histidine kinase